MRAIDKRGTKVRVVLAANTGEILAIHATAAKQDDVSKPRSDSRAKPILASSSSTTGPAFSVGRRGPSSPVSSPPMQILPKMAAFPHKIASAAHPVSLSVDPLLKVAANEPVEARIPTALLGRLRSVGLTPATAPVKVEPTYVVQAINQRGMTLRVLLAANSGDILAIQLARGAAKRERRDGETRGSTDSAQPGTVAAPREPHLTAAHPPSSGETPFIAPWGSSVGSAADLTARRWRRSPSVLSGGDQDAFQEMGAAWFAVGHTVTSWWQVDTHLTRLCIAHINIASHNYFVQGAAHFPRDRGLSNHACPAMRMEPNLMRTFVFALVLSLVAFTSVRADDIQPQEAHSVNLGTLTGVAYYTVEGDGYRVVTTVAQNESSAPVRFVAVLLPNQKVTISVPGGLNGRSATIDIIRRGDNVTIAREGVPTN
jgi:hypothetical protein